MKRQKERPAQVAIKEHEAVDRMLEGLPRKHRRSNHVVVKMKKVYKSFDVGKSVVPVLKDISINLYSGEFVIVYGPSGCGKSTLLHILLGLEHPTHGKVYLREKNIYRMKKDNRTIFRREKIGTVFQQSNWIKSLSVVENVAYPLYLAGYDKARARKRARLVLDEVEILDFARYKPMELSSGQQQRVALARALSTDPWIIVTDEPTGSLDTKASADIIRLLAKLNRNSRRMIVMVTHDVEYLPVATRRIEMLDGRIIKDEHD